VRRLREEPRQGTEIGPDVSVKGLREPSPNVCRFCETFDSRMFRALSRWAAMWSPEVVGSSMRQSNADERLGDVPYGTKTGLGL
jgi:hypothetical protein